MGSGSLSNRVMRPGRGVNHTLSSSAEVKERVQLHLYFPPSPFCAFMAGYRVKFTILPLSGQCHSKPKVQSTEAGFLAQLTL